MARHLQNDKTQPATNVSDHVRDIIGRLVPSWLYTDPVDKEDLDDDGKYEKGYNPDENHVVFDFETIGNGRLTQTSTYQGKTTYGWKDWHDPNKVTDAMKRERNKQDNLRYPKPAKYDKPNEKSQEPFELGLSVRGKDGKWKHKSFMFSPQGTTDRYHTDGRLFKASHDFHEGAMDFHKKQSQGNTDREDDIVEAVESYTRGTGKVMPVQWGEIDAWLEEHGVETKNEDGTTRKTNFIAHNGVFDYPMLERLMTQTGPQGEGGELGKNSTLHQLYTDSIDLHRNFTQMQWQRDPDDEGNYQWYGAYGAEQNWTGAYNRNKQFEREERVLDADGNPAFEVDKTGEVDENGNFPYVLDENGERKPLFENKTHYRRKGDKANGAYFQDSLIEFMRLLGSQDPDSERLALMKPTLARGARPEDLNRNYYPVYYSAGKEWHPSPYMPDFFAAGTSLDAFRGVIGHSAFKEGAENAASELFGAIAKDLNAGNENEFLKDLDLLDSMEAQIQLSGKPRGSITPKDCYAMFNNVASHSGAGDTALMTEILFPFMTDIMKVFDHSQWSSPETVEQGQANQRQFYDSVDQLQKNWGSMLGMHPEQPIGKDADGNPKKRPATISPLGKGNYGALIDNIGNKLGNRDLWWTTDENGEQSAVNPLVVAPKPIKKGEKAIQLSLGDVNTEPVGEDNPNHTNAPDPSEPPIDSTGLNELNKRLSKQASDMGLELSGPITFAKWKGFIKEGATSDEIQDTNKHLIIASVPVGNARLTFSESRRDDGTSTFKPLLGITKLKEGPRKDNIRYAGVRDYAQELYGKNALTSEGNTLGAGIADLLGRNVGDLTKHLEVHHSFGDEEVNAFINTPDSAWLSEGLKHGNGFTYDEILEAGGLRGNADAYTEMLEGLSADEEFDFIQLASSPRLAWQLFHPDNEWRDPSLLGGLEGFNATEITEGDLFQYPNPEDPTQIAVNLQQLQQLFVGGHGIDGVHPQQFLYDHPDGDFDPAIAFTRFMTFMQQVHSGADPIELLPSIYPTPATVLDYNEPISKDKNNEILNDPNASTADKKDAANRQVEGGEVDSGDATYDVADDAVKVKTAAKDAYKDARNTSRTQDELDDRVNEEIERLGLDASPFIRENYIETARAQESLDAAYNSIFKPRETADTEEGVQKLLDDAVKLYGEDSDTRNAAHLVRELEWIRVNHKSIFTHDSVINALNTNDSQSVQGQYLDIMNHAYKALGDSAEEQLALIQEEQVRMGTGFMANSHREFLSQNHEEREDNWYDVDDPTTIQEHFTPEPEEEETRSLRDIARDMAVATAKTPLNALKYYTNWNALSEQWKDEKSGRREAGEKLLGAVRRGEKFREVNIGTEDEPHYATTEQEYNYYIGNLPVQSEQQPSILRQFLQGKRTYGDLLTEDEQSQARIRDNADQVINEQRQWEQQHIAERSAFATGSATPDEAARATGRAEAGVGAQRRVREDIQSELQRDINTPPVNPNVDPNNVAKSLDELREYLLRV